MHTARVIAALAVGAVAGEFLASPLARLFEPSLGDRAGLAAAIALPLTVAGVGVLLWALTAAPKKGCRCEPRIYPTQEGKISIGTSTILLSARCDPVTGRFKAKA